MRPLLFVAALACTVLGQVYPYGWYAFPAWGGVKRVVGDVPLYYGVEKDREQVIKVIKFDKGIMNYVVYVEWKKAR